MTIGNFAVCIVITFIFTVIVVHIDTMSTSCGLDRQISGHSKVEDSVKTCIRNK
jgi:uncharacterized membrane protein